jgi:acyl-CoA reductase-like NAD-dependent aldehyde dehydrogenase
MPSKFVDVTSRHFNPTSAPGLSDEARRAVNAAFDAMSAWRTETVNNGEKSFEQVVDKMAAAARAMGWPDQIVAATRLQMQAITKMQVETVDHLMDAWEEAIKSPSQSSAMLSKLKSLPAFGSAGLWPGAVQMAAFNPFGFYMQIAQQWQKAWTDAMTFWTKPGMSNGWRTQT